MTGRYQSYKEYQSSGVDWLQEVPTTWELTRLGKWFSERRETVSDKDYAPLSVTMQGIVPQVETAAKSDAGDNRKKVVEGDFVINSRSDRKGSSGVADRDGSVSLISIVLEPKNIEARFVHHLMRSQPFQEEFYRYGKGIVADLWSTKYSDMKNIRLALPSREEQKTIARFLDHETGKIDELIAKQERLIELLKEKRQAVISHAVTKGLNPDVPMKDSGVEWLGEVPEHWEAKKLKHVVAKIIDAEHKTADFIDDGPFLVCRTTNVRDGVLRLDGAKYTNEETYKRWTARGIPEPGDVLFTREAPAGEACVVPSEPRLCLGQRMVLFKLFRDIINEDFLVFSLHAGLADEFIAQLSQGSTVAHFNMSDIRNIPLMLPPLSEQYSIVSELREKLELMDSLSGNAERLIHLSKERRTALISAAVTGKIDVRGWQSE
ncbi:restriction endonuclease subunit S [Spongiibacter sp. KMU-166]|uniref:Restriction endonuclease subunit S n=1 Tax=Spongiibacter thalassae TaxID=2721624 RepID=A0ABX1GD79_9GAMM|nr:restriction endonuclease subunit S [Spongiibacter thalassae]NKI16891.1 restriction endonuclease subunit S [Spongiibacter thalassae]